MIQGIYRLVGLSIRCGNVARWRPLARKRVGHPRKKRRPRPFAVRRDGSVADSQRGLGALVHSGTHIDLQMLRHWTVRDMHHVGVPDLEYFRGQRLAESVGLT